MQQPHFCLFDFRYYAAEQHEAGFVVRDSEHKGTVEIDLNRLWSRRAGGGRRHDHSGGGGGFRARAAQLDPRFVDYVAHEQIGALHLAEAAEIRQLAVKGIGHHISDIRHSLCRHFLKLGKHGVISVSIADLAAVCAVTRGKNK